MYPSPFEPRLGDTIKALPNGELEGKLLPFGDETTPDRSRMRDWFNRKSDFGFVEGETITCPLFYHHGLDPQRGAKRYGRGVIEHREDGIYFKGKMDLSDPDARDLYAKIESGEMKMSSGVPSHLVRRQKVGDTHYVATWILGSDASITENPADQRTWVASIKALVDDAAAKSVMSETGPGTGYAPANNVLPLSRAGAIEGLARMASMTHAAVVSHVCDDGMPRDEMHSACMDRYDAHKTASMRMIKAMSKGHPDGDGETKSIVGDYLKTVFPFHNYASLKLIDHFEVARGATAELVGRLTAFASVNEAKGHSISPTSVDEIKRFRDQLDAIVVACKAVPRPGAEDAQPPLSIQCLALMARAAAMAHGV